jgi:hypothetical protein
MEPDDPAVEEVLVLRVFDEARRRRARRAVTVAVVGVLTAGGLAIGLTHRSAAQPAAQPTSPLRRGPGIPVSVQELAPPQIYAAARARYAATLGIGPHRGHLEFGRLTIAGRQAELQVNIVCVPLCGHGEELTLVHRGGTWRVVSARTTWLS